VIDVGVLGDVPFEPDITRAEVAQAAGTTLKDVIALDKEAEAMDRMKRRRLQHNERIEFERQAQGHSGCRGIDGDGFSFERDTGPTARVTQAHSIHHGYSHAINPDLLSTDVIMVPG